MNNQHQRRWQPLLQQWVIIAAKSQARPWSGQSVGEKAAAVPRHDPDCYLCPGVTRASGHTNPTYQGAWAFENDFASLIPDNRTTATRVDAPIIGSTDSLNLTAPASGRCRVLCWSADHSKTLADLSLKEMQSVVELWQEEFTALKSDAEIQHILIFENKGEEVGVSNRHPHGQIYAMGFVSDTGLRMRQAQSAYAENNAQASLLQDLINRPEYQSELLIEQTEYFKTVVPFAARFPYESWIVPRRHVGSIDGLTAAELENLAGVYQRQAQRYDSLFRRSSPNVTLLHNAPCDDNATNTHWCFHIALQPPLRDSSTLKYLAGFESGANNVINPVQPELAAEALRQCNINRDVA
ncbi:MAG: galactose-1-phosphate uridylyltransferase [Granulosicoccus sp.]|nr:galactose-1-phosphate uridylyltransferase [Granulosicoccus sp.]